MNILVRFVHMKWTRLLLWKIQSGHDYLRRRTERRIGGRTGDRRTHKVKPLKHPLQLRWSGVKVMTYSWSLIIVWIWHLDRDWDNQIVKIPKAIFWMEIWHDAPFFSWWLKDKSVRLKSATLCRTGDNPWFKVTTTYFTSSYICHQASIYSCFYTMF